MTGSPLSAGDVRAAAETHRELGPGYWDAVIESFAERVGAYAARLRPPGSRG